MYRDRGGRLANARYIIRKVRSVKPFRAQPPTRCPSRAQYDGPHGRIARMKKKERPGQARALS
jgi:hypothetical protein